MQAQRCCIFVFGCCVFCVFTVFAGASSVSGASLLGHEIAPGKTVEISFPVDDYHQNYAAQRGNPRPAQGRMVLSVPAGFNPARAWPILIVTSTSDNGRTSPMDAKFYQQPGVTEGWIVLATDAAIPPKHDTTEWRLAMLAAALQIMHKEWPHSASWPLAFAGLSGGAKQSCAVAALMSKKGGSRICGIFLAGLNDDRLTEAYQELQPPPAFLEIPVWLSSGSYDRIAPPGKQEQVLSSMQHSGFRHVRLEPFAGRHEVSAPEVQRALRWFREAGRF